MEDLTKEMKKAEVQKNLIFRKFKRRIVVFKKEFQNTFPNIKWGSSDTDFNQVYSISFKGETVSSCLRVYNYVYIYFYLDGTISFDSGGKKRYAPKNTKEALILSMKYFLTGE